MKITINNVTISLDTKTPSIIEPQYSGSPEDILKVKDRLNEGGARGMYGNSIDIDKCLAVDFLSNLGLKYPGTKIPKIEYNPKVPEGATP